MDIPYDVPGPSDVSAPGEDEPTKLIPVGVPLLSKYRNGLLELKLTRDSRTWDRSGEAYRWAPEEAA